MRIYRKIQDKGAAVDYIVANRAIKTLNEMSEDLNISRERVRQLAVMLGVEKPKKSLAWYRQEVKRLQEEIAKLREMQSLTVATMN